MLDTLDKSITQEAILLEKLARIEGNASGYFAIHIHLSRLRANNRKAHFIGIAARTFDNLVMGQDAILYQMMNQDFVLICREVLVEDIDPYIEKVRGMFNEDPLAANDDEYEDKLTTWYDLASEEDFVAFVAVAKELSAVAAKKIEEINKSRAISDDKNKGDPLEAKNLAAINQKLQQTRVADLIRHQTCIRIAPGKAGEIVFREHFIAMTELRERVAPAINLFSSAWLFQYLTETLDRRVIAVIGRKNFAEVKEPISLNLNVGTTLSRDFKNFMQVVGDNASKVVVEFQIMDIFADMNTYAYARDMLQSKGFRVVVDGVTPLSLQFFDPATLKPDFIKIAWGKEFEDEAEDSDRKEMFTATVKHAGRDSVILARVDSERAIKWGMGLGISRFQGHFIDKLVAAMGRPKVKPKVKAATKTKPKPKSVAG